MRKFNSTTQIKRCRSVHNDAAAQQPTSQGMNDLSCQMCGVIPGDIDDLTGEVVALRIGHIDGAGLGSNGALSDFDVLCSSCCQGAKEIIEERARLCFSIKGHPKTLELARECQPLL
jgi:hypothetical protein